MTAFVAEALTLIGPVGIAVGSIAVVVLTSLLTRTVVRRKIVGKIDFMSDALDSGESAFRYSERRWSDRHLNRSLNRLRSIFEADKNDIREREQYFGTMLDHVQSGVVVLDGEKVDWSNAIARGFLGMSDISSLRQVERISPELADAFRNASGMESRASLQTERGEVQFSISACSTMLHSRELRIVTFNDITRDMENSEYESWTRLIRVLTHEIMNTVTPIASLSSALSRNLDGYGMDEVRDALRTIASSSEGLISFVQSYRALTHIQPPVRKAFELKDLVNDSVTMAKTNWPSVCIEYRELSEDIIMYADYGQLLQVMNNLLKNAVQAGARHITVSAMIDKRDRTVIDVSNDGEPISKSGQEQIFVPFYTTKGASGTGVGLSLCRQMVRMNGGTINLASSTMEATTFTIVI